MICVQSFNHPAGTLAIASTSFSPILRDECKRVPGMQWYPPEKLWVGYPDAVRLVVARSRQRGLRIETPRPLPETATLLPVAKKDLRDYQCTGVDFLLAKAREGALLADDMGLGKTIQAIRAARAFKRNTLIVCPSFVRGVWVDELAKWWPDADQPNLPKGTKVPEGALGNTGCITIIHYDILYAWVPEILRWDPKTLIIDAGQYCQGENSRRTKAVRAIRERATWVMMLTGTPVNNRPIDLWAIADTLSPGRFGKRFTFALRYAAAHQEQVTPTKAVWKMDGISNAEELRGRITYSAEHPEGFMLRRLKSEVALELPSRTRQIIKLEVPRVGASGVKPSAALRVYATCDKILRQALERAADAKVPQVIDLVCDHLTAGSKVVVGSHRKAIAHMIHDGVRQKMPCTSAILTGEIPTAKRHALIKSQPDLTCCTLDATQVGINLSYANVGIIAEPDYVPAKLAQWEARFGREPGRNVLIQYCLAPGTVDDIIRHAVIAKLDVFDRIIGKNDDEMREELEAIDGANGIDRLRALYEKLIADD
jgi:SWI/SNF-related matrix-associated actin-dependent regulator of chromatin subfamily A-like protein 1